jgi:hypothetical protein
MTSNLHQSRFAWVQAYFAAKRRQFDAAGYPTDVGGLMENMK